MAAPRAKAPPAPVAPLEDKQVYCWACRALVVVPIQHHRYAHVFKCGWCGAINPQSPLAGTSEHPGLPLSQAVDSKKATSASESSCSRCLDQAEARISSICECSPPNTCCTIAGVVVVVLVTGVIAGISVFGVYPVLYDMCKTRLPFAVGSTIAVFLMSNIFFNYCLAVLRSPGEVHHFYDISSRPPERHTLNDFTYCHKCEKPKPPNAHHCSICGFCIVDMDHHCPFLNNCVGRGNVRPFLLFLFWVVVGMLYALPLLFYSVFIHRASILKSVRSVNYGRPLRPVDTLFKPTLIALTMMRMSATPFVALLLIVACIVVLAMVGSLCVRHWWFTLRGFTFIGAMKGEHVTTGGMYENLQYVFGNIHPVYWILPSFRGAPERMKLTKGA